MIPNISRELKVKKEVFVLTPNVTLVGYPNMTPAVKVAETPPPLDLEVIVLIVNTWSAPI